MCDCEQWLLLCTKQYSRWSTLGTPWGIVRMRKQCAHCNVMNTTHTACSAHANIRGTNPYKYNKYARRMRITSSVLAKETEWITFISNNMIFFHLLFTYVPDLALSFSHFQYYYYNILWNWKYNTIWLSTDVWQWRSLQRRRAHRLIDKRCQCPLYLSACAEWALNRNKDKWWWWWFCTRGVELKLRVSAHHQSAKHYLTLI